MVAVLFDLDGVLYEGEQAVRGAPEAVEWFQRRKIPHLFLTNTTSRPRKALVEKLARFNIRIEPAQIFTPPVADGLRLDVAPFVVGLEHATGTKPVVLGKPAGPFYRAALELLQVNAGDAVMIGDDVRGDVDGSQKAGLRGILVRTGQFQPGDIKLGITPHAVLNSVAEFPQWWKAKRLSGNN